MGTASDLGHVAFCLIQEGRIGGDVSQKIKEDQSTG